MKVFRKRFSRYLKRTNFLWPVIWKPFIIRAYLCTIAAHWTFLCTIVHNFALFSVKLDQVFCIKLPCSCQRVLTDANQCVPPTKSWRKNICQKQHLQCWDLAASCFKQNPNLPVYVLMAPPVAKIWNFDVWELSVQEWFCQIACIWWLWLPSTTWWWWRLPPTWSAICISFASCDDNGGDDGDD